MDRKRVLEPVMGAGGGRALRRASLANAVQPWSGKIVTIWIVGYLIELVILGALVALIYRPKAAAA